VGLISNDPVVKSMAFTNSAFILEEGTILIFGSWVYVADGQGGFSSHLADSQGPRINPLPSSGNSDHLADHFSKIQLFDSIKKSIPDLDPTSVGQEDIQSGTHFNQEKFQTVKPSRSKITPPSLGRL